jgi:2-dehydropantoate 2-reductase
MNAIDALKALTGRRGEVLREPGIQELARRLADECVAVARAEGARLEPADGHAVLAEMLAMPPDQGTSILADRLAGRPLEWDARNDVIRRLGARHGVPTPVSDVLVPLLAALDP